MKRHRVSVGDPNGRLVWRGNELLREVPTDRVALYTRLLSDPRIEQVFGAGLVRSELIAHPIRNDEFALRHQRVPFVTYASEWSSQMLCDAATMTLDLNLKLLPIGLIAGDIHPWNVLFDGAKPVFVDWGAIVDRPLSTQFRYVQFRSRYLIPLYLMASGYQDVARSSFLGVHYDSAAPMIHLRQALPLMIGRAPIGLIVDAIHVELRLTRNLAVSQRLLDAIRRHIARTSSYLANLNRTSHHSDTEILRLGTTTIEWIRSVITTFPEMTSQSVMSIGFDPVQVEEIVSNIRPPLIVATNSNTVADEQYGKARHSGQPILPVVLNLFAPTAAHGEFDLFESAEHRLKCDVVVARGLLNRFVRTRHEQGVLDSAIAMLERFSRSMVIAVVDHPACVNHDEKRARVAQVENAMRSVFRHVHRTYSPTDQCELFICHR